MKNRLETIAWIDSLLSMPMANVVDALNEYRNELDRELPEPPNEVFIDIDAPIVVEEAPTIEEYIAPKVGDKIVIDDPRYNYYKTGTPKQDKAFMMMLADVLKDIDSIKFLDENNNEVDSMIFSDGSEEYAELQWKYLSPKEGCKFPYRIYNCIEMRVYQSAEIADPNDELDVLPVVRHCEFYLNQLPQKIQTTLKRIGIFTYNEKTGIPYAFSTAI